MKAAALLVEHKAAVVVDVRSPREFALYHVPGAQNEPDASATRVAELAMRGEVVLLVASRDDLGLGLVDGAREAAPGRSIHYLKEGARAFYLAFELPVPLFSETAAPNGYDDAMGTLRRYLADRSTGDGKAAAESLDRVARSGYRPTLLKGGASPKAGGGQKKISGGCG
jgi:rhodanese-related sulfurtransferase